MAPQRRHEPVGDTGSVQELIVIADDDEFFRMALKTILQNQSKQVEIIEAASFDQAMEQMAQVNDISLAVFDLMMPGVESAATLRAVRKRFPGTKLVVASASNRRSDMLLALDAGAHGYVPKGLGIHELSHALQEIRQGKIYVPASITNLSGSVTELSGTADQPVEQAPTVTTLLDEQQEHGLTPRQLDVLALVVKGLTNKEIAQKLNLGEGTVKVHMAAMFRTLNVTSRSAAAARGAQILASHRGEDKRKPR